MATESPQSEPPPQVVLYHLATGHYISRALCLAAKLGIGSCLRRRGWAWSRGWARN